MNKKTVRLSSDKCQKKKKKYKRVSNARQFIEYQTPPKMDLLNYSNCYFK